jgi:hypothetical protein
VIDYLANISKIIELQPKLNYLKAGNIGTIIGKLIKSK